jgi:hypothetical protein
MIEAGPEGEADDAAGLVEGRRRLLKGRLGAALRIAALAAVFALTHAVMIYVATGPLRHGSDDVRLYQEWIQAGLAAGDWPGLRVPWVYPVGALVPMAVPAALAGGASYLASWCAWITAINAATCAVVMAVAGVRRSWTALIWWLVFLTLLGPVAITRLDAASTPLVLLALLFAATRPRVAACLITIGAWIKVSPGAVILPLFAIAKRRLHDVVAPAAATCLAVIVIMILAGGKVRLLFSFVHAETGRGLQVESVLATPFVLAHAAAGSQIWEFNAGLNTVETVGAGAAAVARVADWLLIALAAGVTALAYRARAHGAAVLNVAALAMLSAMIVGNKVGSPQFIAWLAPPIVMGLIADKDRGLWWPLAALATGISFLTVMIFPMYYGSMLAGEGPLMAVLVLRNGSLLLILVVAAAELIRLGNVPAGDGDIIATPSES